MLQILASKPFQSLAYVLVASKLYFLDTSPNYIPFNKCPGYDIEQSDGKAPVMLEIWGIWSTPFMAIAPWSTLALSGSTR